MQTILFISLEEYTSDITVRLPATIRGYTIYVCNVCVCVCGCGGGVVFSQRSHKTQIIYLYKGNKAMIRFFERIIDLTFFFPSTERFLRV